ncbi:MAG: tRNA (adenosine(37)-N6)-threonylcarbamoyltransferase complex dimerization subunit type 1 TsaB [Mycoplasmataceae bacterium]|nr:tRNA (adenosine(37)-N6)-threonylcarbamoyltransferase complex dimerization subunit type 1 TsaB [Mycoplasmataceae bacterium]
MSLKISWKKIYKNVRFFPIALLIVIIPSLTMNLWCQKQGLGPWGDQNLLIHINIIMNQGSAFSFGEDYPFVMRTIQGTICLVVFFLAICIFSDWYYVMLFFIIFSSGIFNFSDALVQKDIGNGVIDYFQSKYLVWNAIFNFPDAFVCTSSVIFCGIFCGKNIYILASGFQHKPNHNIPISLFIDTTQKKCNLCLFQNKTIIACKSIPTHNNLTDLVVEHINKILKISKVNKKEIKSIYLTSGPGSFTGVRVGAIIAKTWASINKLDIYAIDSLTLQATNECVSILDARGNKFYTAIFLNNKQIKPTTIIDYPSIEKLANLYKIKIIQDYHKIDIFQNLINRIEYFKKVDKTFEPNYIKTI